MQIILLSGGFGKRLWPLSNDARSKQFLQLLNAPDGSSESMLQRIDRQIKESGIEAHLTVATSISQYDSIVNHLGRGVDVVTEPKRHKTFPAIALSTSYLLKERRLSRDEIVVVVPSDAYVDNSYFSTIAKMAEVAKSGEFDMVLMGVKPTKPSTLFGYIVPNKSDEKQEVITVNRFVEKPNRELAKELLNEGALWNAGVFAFRLGYVTDIVEKYIKADSFAEVRDRFNELPAISFDYEVVEKASSIALLPYNDSWSDLGTWSSLTEKIANKSIGNVITDSSVTKTHIVNETDLPIVCLGAKNMIVAASPDGILVSTKEASVDLKSFATQFSARPMYEERRWGTYRVMGHEHFEDGHNALTKLLCLNAGCNISYQYHNHREEIWTFVDGEGILILDGERIEVSRGYVAHIKAGQKHAVKATTKLQIIEVQSGDDLIEEDIIRLDWEW